MPRAIQEPTLDEKGNETHPAFGKVVINRGTVGPVGASLFDSDIRHREVVTLRIHTAERKRDLHTDRIHARKEIIEIEMSLAQWAALVSAFGMGDGVPVTLRYTREDGLLPEIPFEPRMGTQIAETRQAAHEQYDDVREALARYKEHKTVGNLRSLESAINAVGSNVGFAAKMLNEHVENTVTRAKADIEAMVLQRAQALGLNPGDLGEPLALAAGEEMAQ